MIEKLFFCMLISSIAIISLISISSVLAAVEIVIEYNVTSVCSGAVVLTLNPQTTVRGGSIVPSASGLSGCDAKTVYFRENSCAGTLVGSCSVSGAGCTGSAFSAPSTVGNYNYYACIDINTDTDFADAGESDPETLTVEMSTPSVGPLTFSPAIVDLVAGSTKLMKISTTITNADGASDISSCSGYLWNSSVSLPYTSAKAAYTNSSCALSGCTGTTCQCECSFNLWYYDIAGTWVGNATAGTASGKFGRNQGTFAVNAHTSVDVANVYGPINISNAYPIVFSNLIVGDVNKPSTSNPLKVINTGNSKLNSSIRGDDHVGVTDPSWVIKVENMTYNSTVSGMTTLRSLANISTEFHPSGGIPVYPTSVLGIPEKGTFYIYHYISIPLGFKAQSYRGTYYLDVEAM